MILKISEIKIGRDYRISEDDIMQFEQARRTIKEEKEDSNENCN